MQQARDELIVIEEHRHEFDFHHQASHWSQVGDRVTGVFGDNGPSTWPHRMSQLRRHDGTLAPADNWLVASDFDSYS